MSRIRSFASLITVLALLLAMINTIPTPAHAQEPAKLKVVATFSILGDIVHNIGGDAIDLTTIVGPDGDAHTFEPRPEQIAAIADADLIFSNGLDFEIWLPDMIKSSGTKATQVVTSSKITPINRADEDAQEASAEATIVGHTNDQADAHQHDGELDPHIWHDVSNVLSQVDVIRGALIAADPANTATYTANATSYSAQLASLNTWIQTSVQSLSAEQRILFTSHDALGYFARAYGFTIVGTAFGSLSTEAGDPSAGQMAALIEAIKASGVPAIFAENVENTDLMKQIAADAGVIVAPDLATDALTKADGPAPTYLDLMHSNVTIIVQALGGTVATP